MVPKLLAGLLAVAVLSVGGYTYWQFTDGHCCGSQTEAVQSTDGNTPPCCQQLSRTSCVSLSTGDGCCEDVHTTREVLDIPPREVK